MPQKKDPSGDDLQSSVDELFTDPAEQEDKKSGEAEPEKDVNPEKHKSGNTETSKDVKNENGPESASGSGAPVTSAGSSGTVTGSASAGPAGASPGTGEKPQRGVEGSQQVEEPGPDEDSFLHVADSPEKQRIHGTDVPKRIAFELEMMKSRLRHITDQKVTMTDIVEAAIRMCAQEFQENGEEGLVTQLIYKIRERSR